MNTVGAKISVVLADDHTVVRQGLRALLEAEDDIVVVGEAEDGQQAVQIVSEHHPDVALLDIAMPNLNGLQAARQIRKQSPKTSIIMLSMYLDEEFVYEVIQLGASGYLLKQSAMSDVLRAIREVHSGNAFFSPTISKTILNRCRDAILRNAQAGYIKRLSDREIQVLQLIAEGKTNKEAGDRLFISVKTVEKHREHIMNKLDIHEIAGLTRYAIAHGIVEDTSLRKL